MQPTPIDEEANDFQEHHKIQSVEQNNDETTPSPAKNDVGNAGSSRGNLRKLYDTVIGAIRSLTRWTGELEDALQSLRIEVVVMNVLLLLLLVHESLRYLSRFGVTNVKAAALVILIGMYMASWMS